MLLNQMMPPWVSCMLGLGFLLPFPLLLHLVFLASSGSTCYCGCGQTSLLLPLLSNTSTYTRYRRFYCRFCSACGLGQWWFVICLGFLGAVVAIMDIMDILYSSTGPLVSEGMWRNRLHRGSQRLVSPEAERDMKLMVTILSVEHYLLMIFGVLQMNPALLMPWLMMEAVVIALEAIFFGMRLFVEGLAVSRSEVFMSVIVIHNWFQVFCFFRKYISLCDL